MLSSKMKEFKHLGFLVLTFLGAPALHAEPSTTLPSQIPIDQPVPAPVYQAPYNPLPYYPVSPIQDEQQDPHYKVQKTELAVSRLSYTNLSTPSGFDVMLQASNYHYHEPDLAVTLLGIKGGVGLSGVQRLNRDMYIKEDGRFAMGTSDYSGSGSSSGKLERLFDVRLLTGWDILTTDYGLSPFIGFGYRNLYSDDRGITTVGTTNFFGYRRESNYFYIPIGLTQRFLLDQTNRMSITAEYDQLIVGLQTSYLSDGGQGDPDVTNVQHSGRGFRGSVLWETGAWAIGPFANYWNINQSAPKSACGSLICDLGVYEPHNVTIEIGAEAHYHFKSF